MAMYVKPLRTTYIHLLVGLCGFCTLVIILMYIWCSGKPTLSRVNLHRGRSRQCSDNDTRMFVERICEGYTDGLVTGSLCKPLCQTKEIYVTKCIGKHAVKSLIIQAEWKGVPVIIKTIRPFRQHMQCTKYLRKLRPLGYDPGKLDIINHNAKLTSEEFIKQANATLYYGIAGGRVSESTERVLKQVVSECDLHGDGVLEHDELIRCWQIAESEEYMIASLLQGNPAVPKVYGVCGELFVEDYAAPLQSEEFLMTRHMPWKYKVMVALAMLELVETIEDTPYGTLYFSDVKPPNIGVVDQGESLVAKVIDLDSGWFGESARVVTFQRLVLGQQCDRELECDFQKCQFACNTTSHTCTDQVITNNLQVFCQNILSRPHIIHNGSWLMNKILQFLPIVTVQQELEQILHECANPTVPQHHLPKELLNQLRSLLLSSMQ